MKIFTLVGIRNGQADLIEGPHVDNRDICKKRFDAILDARGVVPAKGKASGAKYSELYLTELTTGQVQRRSC
jgi:hypothetical protein